MSDTALSFDIRADYAHFKKYYTTMSPLTFPIPTGTAVRGMLGAILGIDKRECPEYFHDVDISLRVLEPVHKVNIPINYLKTNSKQHFSRFEAHKPTNVEFLKSPAFRLYIRTRNNDTYARLRAKLIKHESVYTLTMGISEALANYENVRELEVRDAVKGLADIHSFIPQEWFTPDAKTFEHKEIFAVKIPMKMKNDREVIEYREVLFERNGEPIRGTAQQLTALYDSGAFESEGVEHVVFI